MTGYTDAVAGYLAYCRRAAAELRAAGSALRPEHHPTVAGALKMIPHGGDKARAAAIRRAYEELTGTAAAA